MTNPPDDYADASNNQTFIVKDERAALKMKREEARAAREKYKAVVAREREAANAQRAIQREKTKLELAKLRLSQSASEKARTNIALTTPAILVVLIGGFIAMLGTGAIPDESVSVASALLTLVATALMQNLRSIVSEGAAEDSNGNGHAPKPSAKKPPTPKP
jgi:small-conductance mechanosensitive channel